ncbi:MAG: hypothetical protein JXQ71_09470 [Verrucomicrobia bacterium]|nr:hypothetical protein [Verrucomicrobiota bacterium]
MNTHTSLHPRRPRLSILLAVLPGVIAPLLNPSGARAQTSANDILGTRFSEPELIQRFEKVLKLTADQQRYLRSELNRAAGQLAELQGQITHQAQRLAPMVRQTVVDEDQVLAQSERIFQLERAKKLAQLRVLIRVNNILTPSQQAAMKEVQQKVLALQDKWAAVQQLLLQQQKSGADLSAYEPLKKEYDAAIAEGAIERAESVLDRARQKLETPAPEPSPAGARP